MTHTTNQPQTPEPEGRCPSTPAAHQKAGFWHYVKMGAGLGFGGRIGWEIGGVVYRWVRRAVLALMAVIVMQCAGQGTAINHSLMQKHHAVSATQQK